MTHLLRFRPTAGHLLLPAALAVLTALLAGPGAAPVRSEQPAALTLLAAGDMRGEIEPCGCADEGQRGGLPRRLSYLAERYGGPQAGPLLVDLGNNLPTPSPQGRVKAPLIQNLLGRFRPHAILPGPNELAMGAEMLDADLPYVLTNDTAGRHFARVRTVTRDGRRIGLYGYLSPELVYQGKHEGGVALRGVDAALLEDWRARRREAGHDVAVLLFRGSDAELARFVEAGLFERIVAGNPSDDELNQVTEREVAGTAVPQVPTKGQGLLRMALPLAGSGAEDGARGAEVQVDWLDGHWPDHPDAAEPFAAYDREVKALFMASMERKQAHQEQTPFAGAEACKGCHAAAYATWQESRHAGAVPTLEAVGKQFDPECLACHVVGLNTEGGFISHDLTPGLAGVQCENCHGPARRHTQDPTVSPGPPPLPEGATAGTNGSSGTNGGAASTAGPAKPATQSDAAKAHQVTAATCRTCHKGSHSPTFSYEAYWPKIAH